MLDQTPTFGVLVKTTNRRSILPVQIKILYISGSCGSSYFRCSDGECMSTAYTTCNNENDCSDGSDEIGCGVLYY